MILVTIKFAIAIDWLKDQNNKSDQNIGEEDSGVDKENMA